MRKYVDAKQKVTSFNLIETLKLYIIVHIKTVSSAISDIVINIEGNLKLKILSWIKFVPSNLKITAGFANLQKNYDKYKYILIKL